MNNEKINKLKQRLNKASSERSIWESTWDDIIFYTRPQREEVTVTNTPGEVRTNYLYDSTPVNAVINLASNINSLITNQSSKWFELTTGDVELDNQPAMKEWLYKTSETVDDALENSNFYTQCHEMYLDLCSIGTGVMYIEEDDTGENELRFQTMHIKEVFILEDKYGEVDTIFRKFIYTARQCKQRWGKNISQKTKTLVKNGRFDDEVCVIHAVMPREDYDENSTKKDYVSIWFEEEDCYILNEGFYNEFPYVVPRWIKNSNEVYGRSPAITSLPDIKTLNGMVETLLKTSQRVADPPVVTSPDFEVIDLRPGSHNFGDSQESFIKPIDLGANIPINIEMIQMYRDSINESFLVTRLQVIDKRQMTAAEVTAREQNNLKVIGPVFGRLLVEFLSRLIKRCIGILVRANKITAPPIGISTISLKYLSPLARAQKMSEMQGIAQTINFAVNLAQTKPDILDNIDFDIAIRHISDTNGAPPDLLIDKRKVDMIRQQRQQQAMQLQQQAQQMEQAKTEGQVVRDMSQADKNLNDSEV